MRTMSTISYTTAAILLLSTLSIPLQAAPLEADYLVTWEQAEEDTVDFWDIRYRIMEDPRRVIEEIVENTEPGMTELRHEMTITTEPRTRIRVRIRAVNSQGESDFSDWVETNHVPKLRRPSKPSLTTITIQHEFTNK